MSTRFSATVLVPPFDDPEIILWQTNIDIANASIPTYEDSESEVNEGATHTDPEHEHKPEWEPEAQKPEMEPETQGDLDEHNEAQNKAKNENPTEE